jgi:signal transduction histidine kinase
VGRVLDEVLDNAIKYATPGGHIVAALSASDGAVRIAVTDSGEGLPADELPKATGRFWRSPRHANIPGSGLGLAIVSALLATFGGELEVAAGDPRGLCVTLVLPAEPAPGQGLASR